jgi:hypothetical protein
VVSGKNWELKFGVLSKKSDPTGVNTNNILKSYVKFLERSDIVSMLIENGVVLPLFFYSKH